jgi:hypothetical protein
MNKINYEFLLILICIFAVLLQQNNPSFSVLILIILLLIDVSYLIYFFKKNKIYGKEFIILAAWTYYNTAFFVEYLVGVKQVDQWMFMLTLISQGLSPTQDVPLYFSLASAFKYALILSLKYFRCSISDELTDRRVRPFILFIVFISLIILSYFIDIAILGVGVRLIAITIILVAWAWVAKNFATSFFQKLIAFLIFTLLLFFVTRSRLEIGVLLLFIFYTEIKSGSRPSIKRLFAYSLIGLMLLNIYAAFRDGQNVELQSFNQGVVSEGESGNIVLLGAFLLGKANEGNIDNNLDVSFWSKILTIVPGIDGKIILADKAMIAYFPDIEEGGFAYPLMADLFTSGGIAFVVISGFAIGFLLQIMRPYGLFTFSAFCVFVLQLFRQELAISFLTLISYAIFLFVIRLIHIMLASSKYTPEASVNSTPTDIRT